MGAESLPEILESVDIEGVDHDDQPVHIRIPGLMVSYCGKTLNTGTHLPPEEVTEPSWCPDCDRIERET